MRWTRGFGLRLGAGRFGRAAGRFAGCLRCRAMRASLRRCDPPHEIRRHAANVAL
jgi:hypothetical protein